MSESSLAPMLIALKLLAPILGAVFGVLALLVHFKDSTGTVTRWGKFALAGVVVSAALSASIQGLEFVQADLASRQVAAKAMEQLTVSQSLLRQVERSIHRIEDAPRVGYTLVLPAGTPGAESLFARLRSAASTPARETDARATQLGYFVSRTGVGGQPLSIAFDQDSPLLSGTDLAPALQAALRRISLDVSLFAGEDEARAAATRIAADTSGDGSGLGSFGRLGDYAFSVGIADQGAEASFLYVVADSELQISVLGRADAREIRKSGRIVSLLDLEAGSGLAALNPITGATGAFPTSDLRALRNALRLRFFYVETSGRRFRYGEREPIRAETSPHGQTLFAFGPLVRGAGR